MNNITSTDITPLDKQKQVHGDSGPHQNNNSFHSSFNASHVLHHLKHYLPSQTPVKDFIHHNTLHAFQNLKFYEAIFKAAKIFGYQTTLQLTEFRELFKIGR